jgi:hypothetical protein
MLACSHNGLQTRIAYACLRSVLPSGPVSARLSLQEQSCGTSATALQHGNACPHLHGPPGRQPFSARLRQQPVFVDARGSPQDHQRTAAHTKQYHQYPCDSFQRCPANEWLPKCQVKLVEIVTRCTGCLKGPAGSSPRL